MNKERQRIKIAEACGLIVVSDGITHYLTPCILGTGVLHPDGKGLTYVPDYLNDLNAMADAIAYLTPEQIDTFAIELSAIVLENPSKAWWDLNANEVGHVITATAAQQAEAFLKTLNLWEE